MCTLLSHACALCCSVSHASISLLLNVICPCAGCTQAMLGQGHVTREHLGYIGTCPGLVTLTVDISLSGLSCLLAGGNQLLSAHALDISQEAVDAVTRPLWLVSSNLKLHSTSPRPENSD
jgi:hypothetical protein